jgi:adenylate cyclase class IV
MQELDYKSSELWTYIETSSGASIVSKDSLETAKIFFQAISWEQIVQNVSTKSEWNCEVERKILHVSLEDISKKILALPHDIQVTLEFTREKFHAVWVQHTQSKERFRVRHEWSEWVRAEYKSDTLSWYKQETGLNIENTLDEVLHFAQKLWFEELSETVKLRTQWLLNYKWKEVRIVVDEFESLRWLINVTPIAEIEVIVSQEESAEWEEIIFEVWELLWFQRDQIVKMWENKLFEIFNQKLWEKN